MTAPWKHSNWEALEAWRKAQELSPKALGKLLGVTDRTLQRWKSGECAPHLSVQAAIEQMIAEDTQPNDATSAIVTTYLKGTKKQISPDELVELVKKVRSALRGAGEEE